MIRKEISVVLALIIVVTLLSAATATGITNPSTANAVRRQKEGLTSFSQPRAVPIAPGSDTYTDGTVVTKNPDGTVVKRNLVPTDSGDRQARVILPPRR
jgi:outer membrane lipoprotein-sorting protein